VAGVSVAGVAGVRILCVAVSAAGAAFGRRGLLAAVARRDELAVA
jgi:hypothetical protein